MAVASGLVRRQVGGVPGLASQNCVAAAQVLGAVPITVAAASPMNSVPPTPVTSGIAAGTSTDNPLLAEAGTVAESPSQSAAPASPVAEVMVWPCEFAWRIVCHSASALD